MNVFDVALLLIIIAAVALSVRHIFRKKGGCSCGCGECKKECKQKT
ncbi:MAG: FeoB-associated Cys-rich membrane protein [Treponema sp.]|nr:FeoB-associated Cys-rich membrane protein [Treponema sp.]